jgi:carboxyl-terminal processing protease
MSKHEAHSSRGHSTQAVSLAALFILIAVVLGLVVDVSKAESDNFYADIMRLENVTHKIHQNYVEEVKSSDLIEKAIEGEISILDPHTTFFKEKEYEELRIHTEGKFGGLGIQISIRDNVLTVMTPMSGTPASRAGIQSGDQIIKIDGKSTKGITIEDAVGKLRGEPGTEVVVTIRRKGEKEDLEYTLTREIITIKSVPFYGVLEDNVGYVRLVTFSQDAGDEVAKAIRELQAKKIKALIFDLRQNPGGLLPQAIDVASLFLDKKDLVVSTRGRTQSQNNEYYAKSAPLLPNETPLVVLVNSASASASEIVAGAIQDWDRGLVIGDTTFGKGSVQTILPIEGDHHLKLTTAFYYTPSGRCINKPENAIRGKKNGHDDNGEEEDADTQDSSVVAADSSKKAVDTTTYTTRAGRVVYGGGGIVPDTVIEPRWYTPTIMSLLSKDIFFKFANSVYPGLKKRKVKIDTSFVVDDVLKANFYAYFDSVNFVYKSYAMQKFDEFKAKAGFVDSLNKDTTRIALMERPKWDEKQLQDIRFFASRIDSLLKEEGNKNIKDNEVEIKNMIKDALLIRELGQDDPVIYRITLKEDEQVKAAMLLFKNTQTYSALLKPRKK